MIDLLPFFFSFLDAGRDRFIDNLSNLGSFITNYNAKMIDYDINTDGNEINTKVSHLHCNWSWVMTTI